MAVGDLIVAADFNIMRSDINSVLGKTSTGYGQTMRAPIVAISNTVTSQNMSNLYLDMVATRIHQTGLVDSRIITPLVGDTVGWNTSTDPNGIKKGIADFISVKNDIAAYDASVSGFPAGNFEIVTASSSSRNGATNAWGTVATTQAIVHTITLSFIDANHITYYFNAGGQIRFSASLTSANGSKSTDWQSMFTAMGVIAFDKWKTRSLNSSGTGSPIGYSTLTSAYQTVYTKAGSGVYSDNSYVIEARKPTTTTIQFRVTLSDLDAGTGPANPIDETVLGTVTSLIQTYRPNSSFTISTINYTAVTLTSPTTTLNASL